MKLLVSIIIPCYNAERWVSEAIQSCLDQTYQPIEVIVIDDGSTDKGLEVIKSFGDKIRWETGPNRGGNHARNKGLALSRGDYIQFLDADDYLLPEKIARQIKILQDTGAGVVYEDCQRFTEAIDGTYRWQTVQATGYKPDVLEALLECWVPQTGTLLVTRNALDNIGGWDENLECCQEWDLQIRLAIAGVAFTYARGCYSAVRRPAVLTVSTRDIRKVHETIVAILKRVQHLLADSGRLTARYKQAMAKSYFIQGQGLYRFDRSRFEELRKDARRLSDSFLSGHSIRYRLCAALFGVSASQRLSHSVQRIRR